MKQQRERLLSAAKGMRELYLSDVELERVWCNCFLCNTEAFQESRLIRFKNLLSRALTIAAIEDAAERIPE